MRRAHEITNQSDLRRTLQKHDTRANKSLGQNFLIDTTVLGKIISESEIHEGEFVLEIGPGPGALTEQLLKKKAIVYCLEIDEKMIMVLCENLNKNCTPEELENLHIIHANALSVDLHNMNIPQNYKLIANIPYYITSPLLRKYLKDEYMQYGADATLPKTILFMMQKEVAEKIVKPNKESVLSIGIKLFGTPSIVTHVKKDSFFPVPKVDSAVLKIDVAKHPILSRKNFKLDTFFKIVEACFISPRKKIHHNISNLTHLNSTDAKEFLKKLNIDSDLRPENLTIENYYDISQAVTL